ncbi:hypothetical protein BpHYR1_053065 [Brachionus plicatilis]|uniref:Uncharacterized protein n=1 Tax=Brachionus plicatilis TaxID=10195 RepID=A0A3M7PTL3_BRAPC|nr:hypothetical protein BpHYR1_053065 [Brachionus plicatilis]
MANDRVEIIREVARNGRMACESLERAAPTLASLAIFENNAIIEEFRESFRTLNASNRNLSERMEEMSREITGITGEIKQSFLQSDENTLKRLYNSAHCTTSKSKIGWIRLGFNVPPEFPKTIENLKNLQRAKVIAIMDYYNLPVTNSLKGNKQLIADYLAIPNLNPRY